MCRRSSRLTLSHLCVDADDPGRVVETLRLMLACPGASAPPSTSVSPAAWRAERLAEWVGEIEGMRRLDLVLEALEDE